MGLARAGPANIALGAGGWKQEAAAAKRNPSHTDMVSRQLKMHVLLQAQLMLLSARPHYTTLPHHRLGQKRHDEKQATRKNKPQHQDTVPCGKTVVCLVAARPCHVSEDNHHQALLSQKLVSG